MLRRHAGPAGIALTRQNIPVFARGDGAASGDTFASADDAVKGAYVLAEAPNGTPDVILIATGSEVQLAVAARETLAAEGINARVVSAPSLEWFDEQDAAYRESRAARSPSPPACRSRPASRCRWRGIVGDTRPLASRSSTSARPPTTRPCSRSSASPPRPSSRRARETIKENA